MIYNYSVIYNGKFYRAGEEVPTKEIKSGVREDFKGDTEVKEKVIKASRAKK